MLFGRANPGRSHISLSYRPHGRYLNTILEIIGYLNLLSPSAMPSGTTLKTPPSLRDTSSINRGGLKVLLFKFYLNSKRRCLFGRANPGRSHISLSYRPHGRYPVMVLRDPLTMLVSRIPRGANDVCTTRD